MIAKFAVLFLVVMVALALIMGRGKKKRPGKTARGVKPTEAARCPDCNSWIVAGARCPCGDKGAGKRG